MRISFADALARLPLPATARWPEGVWDTEAFARGSTSVVLFAPRGIDHQTSHEQDELYIVLHGRGVLLVGEDRVSFTAHDVLFVPAGVVHRFEDFDDDLVTWAIFWGPKGGETGG
jgi:mannose-6-phosphate isomerase-like protein (cupin superfamily)